MPTPSSIAPTAELPADADDVLKRAASRPVGISRVTLYEKRAPLPALFTRRRRHQREPSVRSRIGQHLFAAALLAASLAAPAQTTEPAAPPARDASAVPAAAATPASAPPTTQLKRVEINATRPSDLQERRESTASKIVIGREEIDKFGDATVGEVLRRLRSEERRVGKEC